jgi:hypothetical protein
MTQRLESAPRPPLVRPGVRKLALWLIGVNVVIYGGLWLMAQVVS